MRVCNELKGLSGPVRGRAWLRTRPAVCPQSGSADEGEGRYGNHHRPKYSGAVELVKSEGRFR